jgi:16S rRNA (cytidine1402-2'-O)-methyltransferase
MSPGRSHGACVWDRGGLWLATQQVFADATFDELSDGWLPLYSRCTVALSSECSYGTAMAGTLYVVSMPIGHVEDITYRAVGVLKAVSLIVAEEPSTTKTLLDHYGIQTPITGYHAPNVDDKVAVLVAWLRGGQSVAVVCEAGTPVVCDPGFRLVDEAIHAGITVVPIPGPSATLAAVPVAALGGDSFLFHGPVPVSPTARRHLFQRLQGLYCTLILFESIERLEGTLRAIQRIFGNRQIVLAVEVTRTDEQFIRGRVQDVLRVLPGHKIRGEVTLLIQGTAKQGRP